MKRTTKITAFLLTLVMLLGMIPFSALAADEATLTEAATEESVLDQLAAKATGSLYEGISIPDGATKIVEDSAAIGKSGTSLGVEVKNTVYVDSGYGDGSKILKDTVDDINGTTADSTKTDITFTLVPETTMASRYYVASFNIMRGETYNNYVYRLRINTTGIGTTVTTNSEGEETARTEKVAYKYDINIVGYDAASDNIYIYASVNDTNEDIVLSEFGTGYYTNFGIIVDTEQNDTYYYINGKLVAKDTNFLTVPKTITSTKDGLTTTTTFKADKESDLYNKITINPHYGTNNPIGGAFAQYGKVVAYQAKDTSDVFDSNGKFIYENDTPRTGVTKIKNDYYYFDNGIQVIGGTVPVENYILELDGESGKIIACYRRIRDSYSALTKDELTEAGATAYGTTSVTGLSSKTFAAIDGSGKLTAYRYAADGTTVETYKIDSIRNVNYKSGQYFDVLGLNLASQLEETTYYASEADLKANKLTTLSNQDMQFFFGACGTTKKVTESSGSSRDVRADNTSTFIFSFDAIGGEGLFNLKSFNKNTGANNKLTNIPFLRNRTVYEIKKTDGTITHERADIGLMSIKIIDGVPMIYLGDHECGEFSLTEKTNFTILTKMDDAKGPLLTLYVNGELKAEDYAIMLPTGADYVKDKALFGTVSDHYLSTFGNYLNTGYNFSERLFCYYAAQYYNSTENYAAVTDNYTGIEDNGTGLIYYENGAIAKKGDAATVEAMAGKKYAELKNYSVALADTVHINYYTNLGTLAQEAGAFALLTVGDEEQKVALNTLTKENGLYKITAKLSSIQIGEQVTLEIYDANGNKADIIKDNLSSDAWSYSVQQYAEYILANDSSYTAETIALVKAMLLYGAFAERVFTNEVGLATARDLSNYERLAVQYGTIGTFYTDVAVVTVNKQKIFQKTLNDHAADVDLTGTASDATKVGAVKLVLNSAIKIRIELTATEAPESIEGGVLYTEEKDGVTKYYVDIDGLKPSDLNTVKTVTVDGTEIKITALAVANAVVNPVGDASYSKAMQDLMKAMYLYYYYADAYVKSIA